VRSTQYYPDMPESRAALLERLQDQTLTLRRQIWRTLHAAGSGHVGGALSAAEMLTVLYFHTLRVRPAEPRWPDRDRFVLSKGHANAGLAAVLAMAGFYPEDWLDRFYKLDSPLGMHPDIKVAGVELSTGALGHGLAAGVGMALGARITGRAYRTFVMLGDGECDEGSVWEAALCAARYRLTDLLVIVDYNKVQQSGSVKEIMDLEPLADKWRAFGFDVREIDGHDLAQVVDTFDAFPWTTDKPAALIAHTVKGKGVSFAEDTYVWHQNTVDDKVYEQALAELGARA
jgi:transketolase